MIGFVGRRAHGVEKVLFALAKRTVPLLTPREVTPPSWGRRWEAGVVNLIST